MPWRGLDAAIFGVWVEKEESTPIGSQRRITHPGTQNKAYDDDNNEWEYRGSKGEEFDRL
jgi:hypothetical protein